MSVPLRTHRSEAENARIARQHLRTMPFEADHGIQWTRVVEVVVGAIVVACVIWAWMS